MAIYTVTFQADNGLNLTALLGESSPTITDGLANWETVDRPKRPGITRFTGKNPFAQDIAIRFDGVSNDDGQESKISILQRMAQPGSDLSEPPKIKLSGVALRKDLVWIITGIDEDASSAMWITQGGVPVRVRLDCTVHLKQYIDDNVITTAVSPAAAAQTKKKRVHIKTPQGMTLKQVATLEYPSDPGAGITLLLEANPWLSLDPRKIIPDGTTLTIPDPTTGGFSIFMVP